MHSSWLARGVNDIDDEAAGVMDAKLEAGLKLDCWSGSVRLAAAVKLADELLNELVDGIGDQVADIEQEPVPEAAPATVWLTVLEPDAVHDSEAELGVSVVTVAVAGVVCAAVSVPSQRKTTSSHAILTARAGDMPSITDFN